MTAEKQMEFLLTSTGNSRWLSGEISAKLRTLIASMVLEDPANRPEIDDVMQHPAFQEISSDKSSGSI